MNSSQAVVIFAPPFGGASFPAGLISLSHALAQNGRNVCVLVQDDFFLTTFYPKTKVIYLDSFPSGEGENIISQAASDPEGAVVIFICADLGAAMNGLLAFQKWFSLVLISRTQGFNWNSNDAAVSFWLLALNPTVQSVGQAQRWHRALSSHGVRDENIDYVLLDESLPGGLKRHQIKERIPEVERFLPYDPAVVVRAQNEGTVLCQANPKSTFSLTIFDLASDIEKRLQAFQSSQNPGLQSKLENLTDIERIVSARLWNRFGQESNALSPSKRDIEQDIHREFHAALQEFGIFDIASDWVMEAKKSVKAYVLGFGPLEKPMADASVGEIMVNGKDDIYVDRDNHIEKTELGFINEAQLRVVIERMVADVGRRVDVASPFCDVRLKDGSRVNVVLPPLSLQGPLISIRRFRPCFMSLDDLIREGSLTPAGAETLIAHVQDRANIIIAGNTGSGKTTLLNILSRSIDPRERIITLEDAAELKLQQPHVIRLETRPKNAEGKGEVTMNDLLINALRMRPDRIIVGECRGAEAIPMIQAMNTGHDGSMTTIHANSAIDAIQRLESMILLGAPQWPVPVVRRQIGAGIDVIVFLKRQNGVRKLAEMIRVSCKAGELIAETL